MMRIKRKPSLFIAVLPFIFLIIVMLLGTIVYESPAQIPLILGISFTCILGYFLGYSYEEIEESMIETNKMGLQANFIMLIVGCLIGSWIIGGIVPGMIYYGLNLFTPRIFLIVLPIMCAIISVSTGSAWTTAGTMGTAAMGIGIGMGIPAPLVAGAVVTGASFGDKLSPLSDSTNLAAATAEANLFEHVRHMLKTTIPSFIIALLIFSFLGKNFGNSDIDNQAIVDITKTIAANFKITPLVFIPPLIIIIVIFLKIPPVPGMLIGTIAGIAMSFYQGVDLQTIITVLYEGPSLDTGNAVVDKLLNRGGLLFMMETISLVICALAFGGAIKAIGCVDTIIETILKHLRRRGSIMTSNVLMCILCNFVAADQYMSIVIPGQMYKKVYKKLNLAPENLSRTLEDAGTLTSGLVPWSTCGAVYFATLGVSAFQYGRYHILGLANPIVAIIYAYFLICLNPLDRNKPIKDRLTEEDIKDL
ncbi:MAG: Na+/H+ antiporter NhaC [Fusobacterium sp.]|uniref:Na+/H+ antiporter NhaC n=1 Tax=Fusobacterium sp. TaxID=68766 RepID=UPI0026DCAD8B|nr:Na+/H+ antiporter NhaC [Fusobacterium sp.]MDO4690126.1 Na+/H+ antiporter NhaC [Fusobacterium sp.]